MSGCQCAACLVREQAADSDPDLQAGGCGLSDVEVVARYPEAASAAIASIAASPRPMIITITCDRNGCPSTITLPDQGRPQEAIDAALRSLGWTVTVGTVRRYHACARCAG